MRRFLEKNYLWLVFLILLFMLSVSLINAKNDSLIYDEDAHIPAGYSYLTEHDMRLNPEHPPLLKDIAGLPLLFIQPKFDITQDFWTKDNADNSQWNAGKSFLFNSGNNPDRIIFWSRLPFILLSLILGLFIFKWTREIAGIAAGLIALILYAFDPNILGHNHYVTTDLGIAAFITFTFYYFIKFIKNPNWKNTFFFGLFLGLVQLVKFSSVLTFPVFALILIIYPLVRLHKNKNYGKLKYLSEYLSKGALAFIISLIIVYAVYYLNTYDMPQTKLLEIMNHYFNPSDLRPINVYGRTVISWMNAQPILTPFADYFFGVARVFQRVAGGNTTYFMGEITDKGFLSYFPVVFLIKEPLPIIFLIIFSLIFSCWQIGRNLKNISENFIKKSWNSLLDYIRTSPAEFSMLFFIFLYSITSITGRLNIGLRHLFPIFPFIYILLAKKIIEFIKKQHHQEIKRFSSAIIIAFLAWLILETALAFPNYVSYFNQLAGGSKNGYRYVVDSNADWGQDLKRLKSFLDNHPKIDKIRVDYFGMANIKYYLGDKYLMWSDGKSPESGWYAISVEFIQGSVYDKSKPDNQSYRFLKEKIPNYQVGTSILIYYLDEMDTARANTL